MSIKFFMSKIDLEKQIQFIQILDQLKQVFRQSFLLDQSRTENSAEHSWHAAIAALVLSDYAKGSPDITKVILMLLIHDIAEIEVGDALLYKALKDKTRAAREKLAAQGIFGTLPKKQASYFLKLWLEFEAGKSKEAKFARAIDRFMPVLHNYLTQGKSWKKNKITKDQVLENNKSIEKGSPVLWEHIVSLIAKADAKNYFYKTKKIVRKK